MSVFACLPARRVIQTPTRYMYYAYYFKFHKINYKIKCYLNAMEILILSVCLLCKLASMCSSRIDQRKIDIRKYVGNDFKAPHFFRPYSNE